MKNLQDLHVLVVEDEAIIGMLLEDVLIDIGCKTVDVMSSVEAALTYLEDQKVDFALLDINLNGRLSFPVAEQLQTKAIPFIFLSGYGAQGLTGPYSRCKTLQKPFQPGEIEKAVGEALMAV
ncbi:response regulator [Beijerinckia indica]|uniref:response regulator n=1 Tax=Beijerinckia indica TaxID=533 RepID=UPI00030836E9|nr:response regulator [Beijerinckia indica]